MKGMPERIDHERLRCQQSFDVFEQEKPLFALINQARRRRIQNERSTLHFSHQRRNTCFARRALSSRECSTRRLRLQTPHRDACESEIVNGPQCRRQRSRIEFVECMLRLLEVADQNETSNLEIPCMCGIHSIAMRIQCCSRGIERLRRPVQIARGKGNLCLRDETFRSSHSLFLTERARRASHEGSCSNEIPELRHRNASKRKRGRVVAQRYAL
jgi:hypothetical protein